MKCRYYMLVTAVVKPSASMASLLARLEGKRWARIIDHDELTRRIHVSIEMDKWFLLRDLLRPYADTATVEFKAVCWGRRELLERLARRAQLVNRTPKGERQVLLRCRGGGVLLVTVKGRRLDVKYCRDVSGLLTPSACAYYYPYENIPGLSVKAVNCFGELLDYVNELKEHT